MKRGLVLDPVTGKPVVEASRILHRYGDYHVELPPTVQENLDLASEGLGLVGAGVDWRNTLTSRRVIAADGAQVLNTTTETIMIPDYSFAADSLEVGDLFEYTLMGSISTVITTPGTITFRLRWGGVAGTVLAASGAFAPDPTAALTTGTYKIVWTVEVRAVGSNGTMFAIGDIDWPGDYDDASVTTLKGNLDMGMAPPTAPAQVTGLSTLALTALSPTVAFSVSTATTQLTNHIGFLESLN